VTTKDRRTVQSVAPKGEYALLILIRPGAQGYESFFYINYYKNLIYILIYKLYEKDFNYIDDHIK